MKIEHHLEVTDSLQKAGFVVEHLYGGWRREPIGRSRKIMVFIAHT